MKKSQVISSSFRCLRADNKGRLQILNGHSYIIAEYNEFTGAFIWLRVVLATQKLSIEKWLAEEHPVIVTPVKKIQKAA
jgi:hypothetical protein